MIVTDKEMDDVRQVLEPQRGLNSELLQQCSTLLHLAKFDEAIRSAFILLEQRLRKSVGQEGMTGTNLANYAFNAESGPLSRQLARNKQERDGLRELYSGAFKLFRNPTAHSLVGNSSAEAKSIIGLVNLLLIFLDRVDELPPPLAFLECVEETLAIIDREIGTDVAGRLRVFLGKCQKLGLKAHTARHWIPFRSYALQTRPQWSEPKSHHVALFYLKAEQNNPALWFPVNEYLSCVVGLDTGEIARALLKLGFVPTGKTRDYRLNLRDKNDAEFFEALIELISQIESKLRATL
jgi:uncharacterized protein (TIGR02391 family)